MSGESATDDADLVQVVLRDQQLVAARAALENIDRGIYALVADFAIEHDLHVSRALELLEDQLVHAAPRINERGGDDGERAGLLGVARGGENLARDFQRAAVHAAGHRASAAGDRVVERAAEAGDRVEEDEHVAPAFHEPLGALDAELRDARVRFHIHVVRAGPQFGVGDVALEVGDLLGALVHEQNHELHLGMIFHDGLRHVVQQRGLAGARRGDDEAALAFADGRHEINDARGETVGHRLELHALERADGREIVECGPCLCVLRIGVVDLHDAVNLEAAAALARLGLEPLSVAQAVLFHGLGRHKNIARVRLEKARRVAQEAEALARNFTIAFDIHDLLQLRLAQGLRRCILLLAVLVTALVAVLIAILIPALIPVLIAILLLVAAVLAVIGTILSFAATLRLLLLALRILHGLCGGRIHIGLRCGCCRRIRRECLLRRHLRAHHGRHDRIELRLFLRDRDVCSAQKCFDLARNIERARLRRFSVLCRRCSGRCRCMSRGARHDRSGKNDRRRLDRGR